MSLTSAKNTYFSASSVALLLANLVPLLGVMFLDWRIGEVVLLYWAESAVIGLFNLAKMWVIGSWGSIFFGVFFLVHYGGFMAVHLALIAALFTEDLEIFAQGPLSQPTQVLSLGFALIALLVSHGVSFFTNFLAKNEYEGRSILQQMHNPYGRILVMHFTVLLGGFVATLMAESNYWILAVMIILKITTDLSAHVKQHHQQVV